MLSFPPLRHCLIAMWFIVFSIAPAFAQSTPTLPWDWSGVIGTGQSLAVGQSGRPIASTTQPYGNLKLSTHDLPWPINANDAALSLVPLIEPIGRGSTSYPSSWPTNIAGETPHAAMANQISAMVKEKFGRDFVGVHGEVGENGQGIRFLKKNPTTQGVNGHAFEASMVETTAITRLAKAAGKTYGVGAIIVTHGENDAGNANYQQQLYQLWQDYNTDLKAITGQTQNVLMITSQQNAVNDRSASTIAQWKIGVDHPADVVCSGPKYQYAYNARDGIHLITDGYRQLGEKYGQIYFERVIMGHDWQPLQPTKIDRQGNAITVHFHVPVAPLVWEKDFTPPHASIEEWKAGKGFEVTSSDGKKIAIESAEIKDDTVTLTCATDPGPNARVSYAMIGEKTKMSAPIDGTFRWGMLRDSDPFKGVGTGKVQPNYAVAFEMVVPGTR